MREDTGSRTEQDAAGFEQYRAEASGEADAYRDERRDAAAP